MVLTQAMQVLTSHDSNEWFTPREYIDLAEKVLGPITLDPASNPIAQQWIRAGHIFTKDDDGLGKKWFGKVFCNPPYGKTNGKSNQAVWSQKMINEYEDGNFDEGILLINSTHGYRWYEELWVKYPVCSVRERIEFITPKLTTQGAAKRGQTFVYFGDKPENFALYFKGAGRIIYP